GKYILQIRYTPLWFITALFVAEQILFVLHNLIKHRNSNCLWLIAAFFLMLFFAGYRYLIGVDLPWNADLALLGASFMCLGKWAAATSLFNCTVKWQMTVQMILALSISVICSGLNWYYYCFVDWYRSLFGNPLLFIISAIAGIIFVVRLSELLPVKYLSWLGANTLCFYGFHRLVINYSFGLYNKLGIIAPIGSAAEFALALTRVALSIVLLTPVCLLLLKYIPWCLGKARKRQSA
ncbi:MAG: acyltransferase family protein, partial [Victivallales bacterium]